MEHFKETSESYQRECFSLLVKLFYDNLQTNNYTLETGRETFHSRSIDDGKISMTSDRKNLERYHCLSFLITQ